MADSPVDKKVQIIYHADNDQQYMISARKSIADALAAEKAPKGMPPLPKNVVPRTLQIQLDAKANQGATGQIKLIVVPNPKIPVYATGAGTIPIVKQGSASLFVPVKRTGENIRIPRLP